MKNLFIVSGGWGKERAVSLASGENIFQTLQNQKISATPLTISEHNEWICGDARMTEEEGIAYLKSNNALVFQVVHGTYGEDGSLISLFEKNDITYIGSSSSVMALTLDKYKTEQLLQSHGVVTTRSILIDENTDLNGVVLEYPLIIKPNTEGSSIALYKVSNEAELLQVLEKVLPLYNTILAQKFVVGREFTCGVIEINGVTTPLVPTEVILTKGDLFDYEAKYTIGGSNEVTPPEVSEDVIKKIQEVALTVHKLCGCKDISRTDMIMDTEGECIVLEINTVPGMTKTSFIPAELKASGCALSQFVEGMLKKYA